MKIDLKFTSLLLLANTTVIAGCIASSTSWFVLLMLLVLSNTTIFHKRNQRIQQELMKIDADDKVTELVEAENATRQLLTEILSTVRSHSAKLKKYDETIARLHAELSRHRNSQQELARSRDQKPSVAEAPERANRPRVDATVPQSVRKNARDQGSSDTSGKTV
jgi:uncharacterized protein HemX